MIRHMATASAPIRAGQPDSSLAERYRKVRAHTERLCHPLKTEDYVVSSMPDLCTLLNPGRDTVTL